MKAVHLVAFAVACVSPAVILLHGDSIVRASAAAFIVAVSILATAAPRRPILFHSRGRNGNETEG